MNPLLFQRYFKIERFLTIAEEKVNNNKMIVLSNKTDIRRALIDAI